MMVRAKFTVREITRTKHWDKSKGEIQTIVLSPVISDGNEENKKFFEATPTGEIKLGTVNEAAARQFELGKSYFVDFSPAE